MAEAEARSQATEADVVRTRDEAKRQRALLATTFGTKQKVEQADADAGALRRDVARDQAALKAQRSQMAVLDTEESQLRADAKAKAGGARSGEDQSRLHPDHRAGGRQVGQRGVREGQYVHAGTQVISVVPLPNVWVIANYKETQLTHVAIGQRAEISVDAFPGVVIDGHVDSIAPASGGAIQPVAAGQRDGQVHQGRAAHPGQDAARSRTTRCKGKLRPGMSVTATILTDSQPATP